MKFIADVNVAQNVIKILRQRGHDIVDIKKQDPKTPDTNIIKLASEEKRIIITHDKDFLGLTEYPKYQVGMIVIRLKKQNASHHYKKLRSLINTKAEDDLNNSLTIVTEESTDSYPY